MLLRQDPHALAVLIEAVSDGIQQYLSGVRYERDAPVSAALCPILCFVDYHDDDIFPLLRHLPPLQIQTTTSSSFQCRAALLLGVMLNSSTETRSGLTAFPFATRADGACELLYRGLDS